MNHAVVVGGSRGLGKEVVSNFLARGYVVTVLSRSAPEPHENLNHIFVDLLQMKNFEQIVQKILQSGGRLSYLVFCQRYRGDGDSWAGELQVSLTATRELINALVDEFFLPHDCAIGVVSSVYAKLVGSSQPDSYHIAKAALNQLVKYNAWALGKRGIRINSVMPLTYLKSESKEYYLSNAPLMKLYENLVPLKRMGSAKDSANLIDFLCSEKARFINGQLIFVDGGVSVIWPEELVKQLLKPM